MAKITLKIINTLKNPLYLLFLLLLFLIPIQTRRVEFTSESFISGSYIFYNTLFFYLTDILIIIIAFLWLFSSIFGKKVDNIVFNVKQKRIISILLTFFVLSSLSIIFSTKYYPNIEYFGLFKLILLVLFLSYTATIVSVKQSYKTIFWLILAISLFEAGLGISQYFAQHSFGLGFLGEEHIRTYLPGIAKFQIPGAQKWVVEKLLNIGHGFSAVIRPYGTFSHPNVYGAFMFFSSLATMYLLLISRKTVVRALLTLVIFTQVFAGVISFSRVAIVAWIGSLLILFLLLALGVSREGSGRSLSSRIKFGYGRRFKEEASGINVKRLGIKMLIICAICGFLFYPQFLERGGVVSYGATNYESISDRALYQKAAVEMIKQHPLLGVGQQNFVLAMDEYAPTELEPYQHQPVHNIYLLTAAELGIPAALLLVMFFILLVWYVIKNELRLHTIVLLSALAGFLFIGLFDHYLLTIQQGRLMLFLTVGLLTASLAECKKVKIGIFTEGTILMHKNSAGLGRSEIIQQVKDGEPSVSEYGRYIPIGQAVEKIKKWAGQDTVIIYITSRTDQKEIKDIQSVLDGHNFPKGRLEYRAIGGETYGKLAARVMPDILIEDDCESIGGEKEMIYSQIEPKIRKEMKLIKVREFQGLDHLPDDVCALMSGRNNE